MIRLDHLQPGASGGMEGYDVRHDSGYLWIACCTCLIQLAMENQDGTSNQNEPGSTDPTLNNKTCSHLIHIISRHVSRVYCLSTYQSLEDMG